MDNNIFPPTSKPSVDILEQVIVTTITQALSDKNHFLITLQNKVETVIGRQNSHTLSEIDKRLAELLTEFFKLTSSKSGYEKVGDEIYRLHEENQKP